MRRRYAVVLCVATGAVIAIAAVVLASRPSCGCASPADLTIINYAREDASVSWQAPGLFGTPLFGMSGSKTAQACRVSSYSLRPGGVDLSVSTASDTLSVRMRLQRARAGVRATRLSPSVPTGTSPNRCTNRRPAVTRATHSAREASRGASTRRACRRQQNVGHVIHDPSIAQRYRDYWDALKDDPKRDQMTPRVEAITPTPVGVGSDKLTPLFSPRKGSARCSSGGSRRPCASSRYS
jgi:hypothetical protein